MIDQDDVSNPAVAWQRRPIMIIAQPFRASMTFLHRYKIEALVTLLLAAAFFALYLTVGEAYRTLPNYSKYSNVFFGADHRDALHGWAIHHKGSHPLLLLFVVPMSATFRVLFPTYESGLVAFAAVMGAVTVAAFFVLIRMITGRNFLAAGVTTVFGLSMSQLVFACIPESFEISAAGLITTYLLTFWCLRERQVFWPLWVLAGLLSIAFTITNVMQTFICFCVVLAAGIGKGRRIRLLVSLPALILSLTVGLAFVQKAMFSDAEMFFDPDIYQNEFHYVTDDALVQPGYVLKETLKNFFLFNLLGQTPKINRFRSGQWIVLVYTDVAVNYDWPTMLAALLWIGLLVRGFVLGIRSAESRPLTIAAGLAVLANMGLHAAYSTKELFLYAAHFTFVVLLLAISERSTRGFPVALLWWLLAALVGLTNISVVRAIASLTA